MKNYVCSILYFFCLFLVSCGSINDQVTELDEVTTIDNNLPEKESILKILSLGDSYTIGQSVCETCRFPNQLKDSLQKQLSINTSLELEIIAQTGWTTSNLIEAIKDKNITEDYNLVTLLIGVNNQYTNKDFSIYKSEFPQLVKTSIKAVNNIKDKLIVVSIPDYAFTPFGKGNKTISKEIDLYNNFAEEYCRENNITFVNITDITREGLSNSSLIAKDNLHPSKLAYTKFVERILPFALKKIAN
tara:strand:- start:3678 stop:4412 length:735 start_codon:yes stop_codon:yes gene_type:complete